MRIVPRFSFTRAPSFARRVRVRFPTWVTPALIGVLTLVRMAYVAWFCPYDLAPDEAHYWDWSRELDWCYYSKGPLVALLIRGSCELLGTSIFAIRLPAVLCSALILAGIAKLTEQYTHDRRLAFFAAFAVATLPGFSAASVMMTIDAPLLACWVWAAVAVRSALIIAGPRAGSVSDGGMASSVTQLQTLRHQRKISPSLTLPARWKWFVAGLLVAVGILAKPTMLAFPVGVAIVIMQQRPRNWIGPILFLANALLGVFPILIWNLVRDGSGFRHLLAHAGAAESSPGILGPVGFLGGQFGLLLGVWFIAWVRAVWALRPTIRPELALLWWLSVPLMAVCTLVSFNTLGQPNWPAPAYLSGCVLVAIWLNENWERASLRIAVRVALPLGFAASVLIHNLDLIRPLLAELTPTPTEDRPAPVRQLDPIARLHGWRELAAAVDAERESIRNETGEEALVAGMTWIVPGELGYYCAGHPRVYSFGLALADRSSQYDVWRPNPVADAQAFAGRTFVYVGEALPDGSFDRMERVRTVTPTRDGVPVASWKIWVCRGYRGFPNPADRGHPLRY